MVINLNSDDLNAGEEMLNLAKKLFPLYRTLMGPDIRKSYEFFTNTHPEFKELSFNTNKKVFDWEIPEEWIINEAYIEHESGKKFANFSENNLHIMGYSVSVNKELSKEELLSHIHIHPTDPKAIPYVTSYYKKDWAFCLSKEQLNSLPEGNYRAYIDSNHKKGKLTLQEAFIKGDSEKEIFFSSYLCHPSMANNELSGPVLINQLMKYIKSLKNRKFSYRFVLLPETLGSISYLSLKKDLLKKNLYCGFNLTCVGDEKNFSHISSRKGNNIADQALTSALLELSNFKQYSFWDAGSDERQYCAPGIDLPLCTFCKSKFGEYDEYHTSKDDFKIVTKQGLAQSYKVMKTIIKSLELGVYPKINVFCEPQLGKRNLYPNTSKLYKEEHPAKLRMNIIAQCDGTNTIFSIANNLNKNLIKIYDEISILYKNNLINFEDHQK